MTLRASAGVAVGTFVFGLSSAGRRPCAAAPWACATRRIHAPSHVAMRIARSPPKAVHAGRGAGVLIWPNRIRILTCTQASHQSNPGPLPSDEFQSQVFEPDLHRFAGMQLQGKNPAARARRVIEVHTRFAVDERAHQAADGYHLVLVPFAPVDEGLPRPVPEQAAAVFFVELTPPA